jgi:soluble lytic murein transglycosylase
MAFRKKYLLRRITLWFIIVFIGVNVLIYAASRLLFPLHYWPLLDEYGQQNNVDPLLLAAIIRAESKFYPQAESEAGAKGLMQIIPETGEWVASEIGLTAFSSDKLFDPAINIRIGAWYLRDLYEEFDRDITLALAAYNCGRGNLKRWLQSRTPHSLTSVNDLPYAETRSYVQKVLRNYYWYRRIYGQKKGYSQTRSN